MSPLKEALEKLQKEESAKNKSQVLDMILMAYMRTKKKTTDEELDAVEAFVFPEMEKLLNAIPKTESYREKCDLFAYQNGLMGLFSLLAKNKRDIGASDMGVAKTLVHMVADAQWLEEMVDNMYGKEKITGSDVAAVIEKVRPVTDEFQRGMLWQGTMHFSAAVQKMDEDAKNAIRAFICEEMERYIKKGADMTEEEDTTAEFLADVCQRFMSREIKMLLMEMLGLPQNNVVFYAATTLMRNGVTVDVQTICRLANDLTYAALTHCMLGETKHPELFPANLNNPEYLAKSNLVQWLTYPTELGREPDAIELIGGPVKCKGEKYYVFKFRSNSDNLDESTQGKWLYGWASGTDGGAFSHFELYADVERETVDKTLKAIRKRIV